MKFLLLFEPLSVWKTELEAILQSKRVCLEKVPGSCTVVKLAEVAKHEQAAVLLLPTVSLHRLRPELFSQRGPYWLDEDQSALGIAVSGPSGHAAPVAPEPMTSSRFENLWIDVFVYIESELRQRKLEHAIVAVPVDLLMWAAESSQSPYFIGFAQALRKSAESLP